MEHIIGSTIGTIFAELATLPICTIKTNKILHNEITIPCLIKYIYNQHGIYGFYNSCLPAIGSQIISSTTKYTFYRKIQDIRKTNESDIKNNMINGATSGIIGGFLSHPFDVMKVLKQNNQCITKSINIKNIYRGYSKNFIKSFMLGGLIFPLFDFSKNKFDNYLIASIFSSVGTSTIIYPIEYMKVRHMAIGDKYKFDFNIRKYYNGFLLHNLRCVPHFLIFMYVTEKIKHLML